MITFKEYINEDIKKPILPEIKPDDIIAYVDKYAHDGSGYTYGMVTEQPRSFHGGGGVFLVQCMDYIYSKEKDADRIIVITDEQDCDTKLRPEECKVFGNNFNYLINIASEKNGVGYKNWTHIDGFSESVIDYMLAYETLMSSDNE